MKTYYILIFSLAILSSCNKGPKSINYGEDQCDYCSMGIVQRTHSAQLATQKGKQYKFDAIECMVNYIKEEPEKFENATLLVANYNRPGEMIPAENSAYLISANLPSPMGANLTAFASNAEAKKAQEKLDGKVYQWKELKTVVNTNTHQSQ